ncbi:MAG: VCBS repeat-containing protein [Planctomycetaceae bacterium]|nr:VCBS repeat-containing protein [Planctomycetaceae bacterium]
MLCLAGCSDAPSAPPPGAVDSTTPPAARPDALPLPRTQAAREQAALEQASGPFRFASVASEAGVEFEYYGNPSEEHYMTEQNGGGVGLFDFDCDGRLDLFLANGDHFDRPASEAGATQQLYRAEADAGQSSQFTDVTLAAGLESFGYGMGVAAGDCNNDGFPDLYVCRYGANQLWLNNGDGTFSEVTEQAATGDERWAASAAFADLDDDGDLDLYVTNYVDYSPEDPPCYRSHQSHRVRISCGPIGRTGQADVLYENLGDGRFADVSSEAGVAIPVTGKGLAVQIVDLDQDGLLDIYVANDTTANFLFRNSGGLRFEEVARLSGAAVGADGQPQSSMGIACADYDNNGQLDLYVTNFSGAVNDLYSRVEQGVFLTENNTAGLDTTARPMLAFGTVFADFDLDRRPDLFVANGHIWDLRIFQAGHLYQMPAQLFRNRDGQRFEDVSAAGGEYFQKTWLGRSVAVGDLDNDGDADLVISHELAPAEILRNETPPVHAGVRLRLIGTKSARQALGRKVTWTSGEEQYTQIVMAGGSFQSTSDERLLLATGGFERIDQIRVSWAPGRTEVWNQVPVTAEIVLIEGSGEHMIAAPVSSEQFPQ